MANFEMATRLKLRFESPIGPLSVEDLWDLPLTSKNERNANLDNIARFYHHRMNNSDDVSFVEQEKKSDETITMQFEVVKAIIDYRLAERKARAEENERKEKKQQLLAIISERKTKTLREDTPLEELEKMVADL
jgi:hypothetical protein